MANVCSREGAKVECQSDGAAAQTLSATADTLVFITASLCETSPFHRSRNINSYNVCLSIGALYVILSHFLCHFEYILSVSPTK